MAHIFISYARKDGSAVAEELADRLRAFDYDVFLDVQSIRAGTRWRFELRRRIGWADLIILLVTPGSNESEHVSNEVAMAESINRPILPIQIGDTPVPEYLKSEWQCVKLENQNYDRVLLEIEQTLRHLPVRPLSRFLPLVLLLIILTAGGVFLLLQGTGQPNVPVSTPPTNDALSTLADPTYSEDFEDGTADDWGLDWGNDFTIVDDGTGNHVWRTASEGEVVFEPSDTWRDYAISVDYQVINWDTDAETGPSLTVRRQTIQTCSRYDFALYPDELVMGSLDKTCENYDYFGKTGYANTPGVWHTITIEAQGNHFRWWLDGDTTDEFNDDTYSRGSFGILNLSNTEIWFDNLRLWSLDE